MSDATKPNDGGPAFPQPLAISGYGRIVSAEEVSATGAGISVRDYFAAKAMAAMLASPETFHLDCARVASGAYEYADAMLAEREKRSGK